MNTEEEVFGQQLLMVYHLLFTEGFDPQIHFPVHQVKVAFCYCNRKQGQENLAEGVNEKVVHYNLSLHSCHEDLLLLTVEFDWVDCSICEEIAEGSSNLSF